MSGTGGIPYIVFMMFFVQYNTVQCYFSYLTNIFLMFFTKLEPINGLSIHFNDERLLELGVF